MAWGVDDIDLVTNLGVRTILICPVAGDRSGGDSDTTLALLIHPVSDCATFVDLAHLVDDTCIK